MTRQAALPFLPMPQPTPTLPLDGGAARGVDSTRQSQNRRDGCPSACAVSCKYASRPAAPRLRASTYLAAVRVARLYPKRTADGRQAEQMSGMEDMGPILQSPGEYEIARFKISR